MINIFNFCKRQGSLDDITVHVNVHVMLFGNYVNKDFDIQVTLGTTVKKMLKSACKKGEIKKEHYRYIKKLKHPFSVAVNGSINTENPMHCLSENDKVLIFTPISGG